MLWEKHKNTWRISMPNGNDLQSGFKVAVILDIMMSNRCVTGLTSTTHFIWLGSWHSTCHLLLAWGIVCIRSPCRICWLHQHAIAYQPPLDRSSSTGATCAVMYTEHYWTTVMEVGPQWSSPTWSGTSSAQSMHWHVSFAMIISSNAVAHNGPGCRLQANLIIRTKLNSWADRPANLIVIG